MSSLFTDTQQALAVHASERQHTERLILAVAAREWHDAVEQSVEVSWCQSHDSTAQHVEVDGYPACDRYEYELAEWQISGRLLEQYPEDCELNSKLLIRLPRE